MTLLRRSYSLVPFTVLGLLAACASDAPEPVTAAPSDVKDPGKEGAPTPPTPGKPSPMKDPSEDPPNNEDECGANCTTVSIGGKGGDGFDLDRDSNDGVAIDSDGSLVLDNGKDGASAFIWIANTAEQTVSKISTDSRKEVARYRVGAVDPSRTSVSSTGDAYVGSRNGQGLTKLSALGKDCPDTNQDGVITTSSGPADLLPFGQDDCMLWFTTLTDAIRGVAAQDIPAATHVTPVAGGEPKVTTTPSHHYVWAGGGTSGKLFKLDGETGKVLLTTTAPRGIYGLALDGSGLLWLTGGAYWGGSLGVIDTRTCIDDASCNVPVCSATCSETACPDTCDGAVKSSITLSPDSAYGITVDCKQRVWLGGNGGPIKRYDPSAPADQRLTIAPDSAKTSGVHGIGADAKGWIWGAAPGRGVVRLDAETLLQSALIETDYGAKGIAIAANGDVWAVTQSTMAHVVKPGPLLNDNTLEESAVTGLVSPYTYSDMTGEQLRLATNAPGHYRTSFEGCKDGATTWRDFKFDAEVPKGTVAIFRGRGAASKQGLLQAKPVVLSVAPFQTGSTALGKTSLGKARVIEIEVELLVEGGSNAGRCDRDRTTPRIKNLSVEFECQVPIQ